MELATWNLGHILLHQHHLPHVRERPFTGTEAVEVNAAGQVPRIERQAVPSGLHDFVSLQNSNAPANGVIHLQRDAAGLRERKTYRRTGD